MPKNLGDDDRRAIDLLLDRNQQQHFSSTGAKHAHPAQFAAPVDGDFDVRLGRVEIILNLLAAMPEPEIPANLLDKTLSYIDTAARHHNPVAARDGVQSEQRPTL